MNSTVDEAREVEVRDPGLPAEHGAVLARLDADLDALLALPMAACTLTIR